MSRIFLLFMKFDFKKDFFYCCLPLLCLGSFGFCPKTECTSSIASSRSFVAIQINILYVSQHFFHVNVQFFHHHLLKGIFFFSVALLYDYFWTILAYRSICWSFCQSQLSGLMYLLQYVLEIHNINTLKKLHW